jgi:2-hydroxycyclohexanecarboxyl-CoA dehydrogenase
VTLAGKVVLVTGAARGIGAGIARAAAEAGAAVALGDVAESSVREAAAALGARALPLVMDVSDARSVRAAVDEAESRLGPIDALVNNAGIDVIGPFLDSSERDWERLWAVNLRGTLLATRAVLHGMVARQRGRIVNIGSDAGRVGSSGEAVYSATKGGVIAFTKTLAREVARHGVTVNCVCPGPTDTALLEQVREYDEKLHASLARAIPLRRLGRPEDVAAAVVFLASDAAAYITGQTLSVSGGLTMA